MGRWVRPEVYPLMAAMSLTLGMVVFQLARNVYTNPDVKISKRNRMNAIPSDDATEAKRYSMHGFRRFFERRRPEVMPSINSFFSKSRQDDHNDNNGDHE
ncbi:hypothetical protein GUJ93_ZPchr0003g16623 [Zizania palustris]|uniref:B12D protein n=1 Tax=Zizania palustris TaxID=103762 RepID=A0A8J5SBN0_ZIZPA|nr:hypothetical protein GUJ93_ZPchr0003g16623 [Zizania palustris]